MSKPALRFCTLDRPSQYKFANVLKFTNEIAENIYLVENPPVLA
jgi:hypothetical protein